MVKKKKKPTVVYRNIYPESKVNILTKTQRTFAWIIGATGILGIGLNFGIDYVTGDVDLNFERSAGRGFIFNISNKSSTDQIVESFRIDPDFEQQVVFTINKKDAGYIKNGIAYLRSGNETTMPITEYIGLDGQIIKGRSGKKFRTPPLTQWNWVVPNAAFFYITYKVSSNNKYIRQAENFWRTFFPSNGTNKIRYLVVDNYWTPSNNKTINAAINIACSENENFSKSSQCS